MTSLPLLATWWLRGVVDRWHGVVRAVDARRSLLLGMAFLALAVGFAVVRNTGPGAWLAP